MVQIRIGEDTACTGHGSAVHVEKGLAGVDAVFIALPCVVIIFQIRIAVLGVQVVDQRLRQVLIYTSTAKDDPVNRALLASGATIGPLRRKVGGVELMPEQFDRYKALSGKGAYDALSQVVRNPQWSGMDSEAQQAVVEKTVKAARATARAGLFGGKPKSVSGSMPAPPAGYAVDGAAGGRNVFADIQKAIPGIGITSGYRSPEYQEDMKRRGYKPASDSAHLSGGALDLLPPAGRSMGWLKERVKRFDPTARLLDEGNHLHVTFPGYYGAPPLGGAVPAGVRNPNAGMPAPPPGFRIDQR